jgi:NAD(P)-dependent dehydrogenase (short-subunit alcohol dehydrogenase family)
VNAIRVFVPGMRDRGWGRVVNLASMAGKDGNTCRGLRLVANAWRLYRQAVLPPVLPRRAVLLALVSDADWVRDESGRRVLDASGAEGSRSRT